MNFVHTEEQALLAETARRFADEHVPLERFRARRALGRAGAPGHDPGLPVIPVEQRRAQKRLPHSSWLPRCFGFRARPEPVE